MNPKVSIEKGVLYDCPIMLRVEATDDVSGAEHRILVGLSEEDAIRMRDDLTTLIVGTRGWSDPNGDPIADMIDYTRRARLDEESRGMKPRNDGVTS